MKQLIRRILPEIMEKMFFIVPEELEGGTLMPRGDFVAEITMKGPTSLTLRALVSQGLAEMMAKNLLPDEDPSPEGLKDVLREFANMLGGNLILELGPKWQLGLPKVYEGVEAFGLIGAEEPLLEYDCEGETLAIYLQQ